jgi:hypothetical protein
MEFAKARLRAGHEVDVISPTPSAAHRHHPLQGVRGIAYLLLAARDADGLYLRLDPLIGPTPHGSGVGSAVESVLLARLVRSVPHCVLDVTDIDVIRESRMRHHLIGAADEIVIDDDRLRDPLLATGVEPFKIRVVASRGSPWDGHMPTQPTGLTGLTFVPVPPLPRVPPDADRATIERLIRTRAAEASRYRQLFGRDDAAATSVGSLPILELPTPPNTVKGRVARVISRFTAWQLRPMVEHVNRLQHALQGDLRRIERVAREPFAPESPEGGLAPTRSQPPRSSEPAT